LINTEYLFYRFFNLPALHGHPAGNKRRVTLA
jgi:hypothetical protein